MLKEGGDRGTAGGKSLRTRNLLPASTFDKSKLPSRHATLGADRAPNRSYYFAMGLTRADIELNERELGVRTAAEAVATGQQVGVVLAQAVAEAQSIDAARDALNEMGDAAAHAAIDLCVKLFANITEEGNYMVDGDRLRLIRSNKTETVWPIRRDVKGRLQVQEAPNEWHTYTHHPCASFWPCSSR